MLIIKLNATDSTNDYLKQLHKDKYLEDYTVVVTDNQTNGKGQMGAVWLSEPGKNLTFSVLAKGLVLEKQTIFDYNIAVTIAILEVLQSLNIPKLNIKWPNDILAESKKLGGILIENSVKADGTIDSIIGIGLNINQEDFVKLPTATSLKKLTQKTYDLDLLLAQIVTQIVQNLTHLYLQKTTYWNTYIAHLFKINVPVAFENNNQQKFMGIIKGVTPEGKLSVQLEDDSVATYGLKEVRMLY